VSTLDRISDAQQNDPNELLEVFTSKGSPTGAAKPRAAIHRAGDWHLAFHCWVLRRGGQEVVLQQRSLLKDTFPGCWDAAAAGHWRFGESPAEAAREIGEELGIEVAFDRLVYRGRERSLRQRMPNGLIDREWHEVYVLHDDRPLSEYRPDVREVIGLAAFNVADLIALASSRLAGRNAREAYTVNDDGSLTGSAVAVSRADLVPYSAARLRRTLGSGYTY
jgi:isopentenyldiphosphate isomerase